MQRAATSSRGSSAPVEPLPIRWVERLFSVFLNHYGKRFLDQWADVEPEALKQHWAQHLAVLSEAELRRGLSRLNQCAWPPSLPEFRKLCRSAQDYEAAFFEAVRESHRRRDGLDEWSEAAVFWAAVRMGHDLHGRPYADLRARWRDAMDSALKDVHSGKLPDEVPPARPAHGLPPPPVGPTEDGLKAADEAVARMRAALGRAGSGAAVQAVDGQQAQHGTGGAVPAA